MTKIIRRPDFAGGGITPEEKERMDAHAKLWISRAMRTDPIEPAKIIPAIKGLYEAAGLDEPRVVIVPSPLVMAFAYGAAASILDIATHSATDSATFSATRSATRSATHSATYSATDIATHSATDSATDSATRSATRSATHSATYSATDIATHSATRSATDSATHSATRSATHSATYSATDIATHSATRSATHSATYSATDIATHSATRSATDSATRSATHSATYSATDRATDIATDIATRSATYSATDSATHSATRSATDIATRSATHSATYSATDSAIDIATGSAESGAALACMEMAGVEGIKRSRKWYDAYQGGNMWAGWECYLTAARDILGLVLPEHEKYTHWEQAAIHGGFRVLHPEFCLVCDFPEFIHVDEDNEPHCETGPSHKWRDGWALYHWHGVHVPEHWIESRESLSAAEVLQTENLEQRRAGCEIIGWDRIIESLGAKVIDTDPDPQIGELVECDLPDSGLTRFVKVQCATGRTFALCCDTRAQTAMEAQAGLAGVDLETFKIIKPTITA